MYFFDLKLDGTAVNEQWRTEAEAFDHGATALVVAMENKEGGPTARDAYAIARLFLLSHRAYQNASAATIGHTKTESYQALAAEAELRALEWFQQMIVLRPDWLNASLEAYLKGAEERLGLTIL